MYTSVLSAVLLTFLAALPVRNANIDSSKILEYEPVDEIVSRVCAPPISMKWHSDVGSNIYATPLITDLYSDGERDIIIPTFSRQLQVTVPLDRCKTILDSGQNANAMFHCRWSRARLEQKILNLAASMHLPLTAHP